MSGVYTTERRKGISDFFKEWHKRIGFSPEVKEKIATAHRGKPLTIEHRTKLSLAKLGKPSPRRGIKTGRIPWNKGLTAQNSQKIAELGKKSGQSRKGKSTWNKGKSCIHSGSFKKGHKLLPGSEKGFFKKGQPKELTGNWRGGKMENYPALEQIRKSFEYTFWRREVLKRDHFTCQKYKTKGGKLIAHHINNFLDFPELRLAMDNGITLSMEAHKEFHKKYGNRNNTKEQLEEFLVQV